MKKEIKITKLYTDAFFAVVQCRMACVRQKARAMVSSARSSSRCLVFDPSKFFASGIFIPLDLAFYRKPRRIYCDVYR